MRLAGIAPLSALAVVLAGSSGCAQSKSADYQGTPGQPIAAQNFSDTLSVPITANGVSGDVVVDTGSPIVALDPSVFVNASLPNGAGNIGSLVVGALTFHDQYVIGANLLMSADPSQPIGGSLGCGVLCKFATSLNYRDLEVTLGDAPLPANVEDSGESVPFMLEGGLAGSIPGVPGVVIFPASRIVLTVTIEGQSHVMAVDTGSSVVVLRQAILSALATDGRTVLSGVGTVTQSANSTSSLARLRSVVVGGQEVNGLIASDDPAIDTALTDISAEVGHTIDGLLGGSFLRQFFVTVDYPASALGLRRYTSGGPTFDFGDRVGFTVVAAAGTSPATVSAVQPSTDAAAKGVAVGDQILAVDGHPLSSLGPAAANALLTGPVGSVKMVQFGVAASSSLSMQTVGISVADILPL